MEIEPEIQEELPPEMYAMIMEEIKEPETYSAISKTSRSLRELALQKESLGRAKERFFHGIDPYLYQQAKKIVLDWTPVEYQCDEVNRYKIQEIAEAMNRRLKDAEKEVDKLREFGYLLVGVPLEDVINYITDDSLEILMNLKHKRKFKGKFPKISEGLSAIGEGYVKSFKPIVLEILEHYDLYDPYAEHT